MSIVPLRALDTSDKSPRHAGVHVSWTLDPSKLGRGFSAVASEDGDGSLTIIAEHFPGVISQGDTLQDAIDNIREAFLAMEEACQASGVPMETSLEHVQLDGDNRRRLWIAINA